MDLTLIVNSFGQRKTGDNIENFHDGDLVLVGGNLQITESDQCFNKIVIGIGQWHIYFVATGHISDASFKAPWWVSFA